MMRIQAIKPSSAIRIAVGSDVSGRARNGHWICLIWPTNERGRNAGFETCPTLNLPGLLLFIRTGGLSVVCAAGKGSMRLIAAVGLGRRRRFPQRAHWEENWKIEELAKQITGGGASLLQRNPFELRFNGALCASPNWSLSTLS